MIELTPRQRRILTRLIAGDLLWEVADEKYFTQFEERTGRQLRVHLPALQPLESAHLIYFRRHPAGEHRLDFWEITEQGRAALAENLLTRNKSAPGAPGKKKRVLETVDPAA